MDFGTRLLLLLPLLLLLLVCLPLPQYRTTTRMVTCSWCMLLSFCIIEIFLLDSEPLACMVCRVPSLSRSAAFVHAAHSASGSGLLARSTHGRCWLVSLPNPGLLSLHEPWPPLLQQLSRRASSTFEAVQHPASHGCAPMENV